MTSTTTLANGIQMPYLGLGVFQATEENTLIRAIHCAIDNNYRLIDTAALYENEDIVGKALKSSSAQRAELFITTKVWFHRGDEPYQFTWQSFAQSLAKLQLEYIDLFLIHWLHPKNYLEQWRALEDLYHQGKVKAIGVCNANPTTLSEMLNQVTIKPMVVQNQLHPQFRQPELLTLCRNNKIQLEAWSPLMRGEIFKIPQLQDIAASYNKNVAQLVLRWNLQNEIVAIPKSVNPDRIISNAAIFDFTISEIDMAKINALNLNQPLSGMPTPENFIDFFDNLGI